jgi:hypothetical protein
MEERMQRSLNCAVFFVVLAWTVSAHAAPPSLKGNFAFTGTEACLFAPGSSISPPTAGNTTPNTDSGFNPNTLRPVNSDESFSSSSSVEGVRTFDESGNGKVSATEVGITVPPTPEGSLVPSFFPSAQSASFSYDFTYTINAKGSFTATAVPGSFTGNIQAGPRKGQTFTIANFPQLVGNAANGSTTLVLSTLAPPTVETVTFSNGDVWPRICHRSRVLLLLQ